MSLILPGKSRAKKFSLTLNLGIKGLVISELSPLFGEASCMQGRNATSHPSKKQVRSILLDAVILRYCQNSRVKVSWRESRGVNDNYSFS